MLCNYVYIAHWNFKLCIECNWMMWLRRSRCQGCYLCWPFVSKSVQNIWPGRGYELLDLLVSAVRCRLRPCPHNSDRAAQPSFLLPCCEMQVTSSAQKRYLVVDSCITHQDLAESSMDLILGLRWVAILILRRLYSCRTHPNISKPFKL